VKLNRDQKEALIQRTRSTWKQPGCVLCGNNKWSVSDEVFEAREFHGGVMKVGGGSQTIPLVVVSCGGCGQVIFMNLSVVGIDVGSLTS